MNDSEGSTIPAQYSVCESGKHPYIFATSKMVTWCPECQKEEAEQQLDAIREACRETSDDWAPEHPPYAAQDLIERITGILDGGQNVP